MGDLIANYEGGGGCAGAHDNSFVCGTNDNMGQNSCCGRGAGANGRFDTTAYSAHCVANHILAIFNYSFFYFYFYFYF
jgi:hypothetical protein